MSESNSRKYLSVKISTYTVTACSVVASEIISYYGHFSRRHRKRFFTPDKPGPFIFTQFFGAVIECEITQRLLLSVVKSSEVWTWKFCYFKWVTRYRYGVFIFLYTIFQAFRTWNGKSQRKSKENLIKIQKSVRRFLPPAHSS